ncbi:MAG: TonB-dependent receptor [Ignavibacteriales bacterium]|nr:TonB-dependent receptor [Ignavibacteriales bacterium]
MHLRKFFLTFLFLLPLLNLHSQNIGTLRGLVTDSTNGEVLAFCNVYIKSLNTGATTDSRGYFIISSIPSEKTYDVTFSYVGYKSKVISAYIGKNKVTHIDIALTPAVYETDKIEVIGKNEAQENNPDIGLEKIVMKQIEVLPKGIETDILKSLQFLPGVRSTGDISAKYYVRGGSNNQNLILLDGIELYNPFHALGLFSVIDAEIINNAEFYKGGFPAEFGGRISSVLSIISKDGNRNNYSAKAGLSYLSGKLIVEGPIPNGSFYISGRKSYSTSMIKKFYNEEKIPFDFYDAAFKINYSDPDFIKGSKITLNGFFSDDKLINEDPYIENFKWNNELFGFHWFQVGDSPLFFDINLSYSHFLGEIIPNLSSVRPLKNEITDFSIKSNYTYVYENNNEIGFGIHIKDIKTKYISENSIGLMTDVGKNGTIISAFAKYKFMQFENLGIDLGTRVNLTRIVGGKTGSNTFEPRISMNYSLFPGCILKAAYGLYIQDLTTIADEEQIITLLEPWIVTPDYLQPEKAIHYILGVELNFFNPLQLIVETYYKDISNLHAINKNKILPGDRDLVDGKGKSYGVEFSLKYPTNFINLSAAYSLAWAYKEVEGWKYYPKYDSKHTVNLLFDINIGYGFHMSSIWTFSSGLPFTQISGYFDKFIIEDPYFKDYTYGTCYPFTLFGDRNIGRLPTYHRLDLSLIKKFEFAFLKCEAGISILNVYDRKNIFYYKIDTGERVNMLPFLLTGTLSIEI